MSKKIAISIALVLVCIFLILTILGKQLLPSAALTHAWLTPFGSSGYLTSVRSVIDNGFSEQEVLDLLGDPSDRMVSVTSDGRFSLVYAIPNRVPAREFVISFNSDRKVDGIHPITGKIEQDGESDS